MRQKSSVTHLSPRSISVCLGVLLLAAIVIAVVWLGRRSPGQLTFDGLTRARVTRSPSLDNISPSHEAEPEFAKQFRLLDGEDDIYKRQEKVELLAESVSDAEIEAALATLDQIS